jgi:threonine dehydratase
MLTFAEIEAARGRIADAIYQSPCAYSETFSKATGNKVFFKLENLQMTGSFKERGALNKLLLLSEAERAAGVITASAGNHAQGVAYHAGRRWP